MKFQYSRFEHAKAYQVVHGGTFTDALRAIWQDGVSPTVLGGGEHLRRAKLHQQEHGGTLTESLRATAELRPKEESRIRCY